MEPHTSLASDVSSRDRWLITALLGLGLITFANEASPQQAAGYHKEGHYL